MPSRIQRAVSSYREALNRDDAAAQARLVSAYQAGQQRITTKLNALTPPLESDPTPSRVLADARYRTMLAELDKELGKLGTQLVTETTARQATLVNAAGPVARGLVAAQAPEVAASFATISPQATRELV